MVVMNRDRPDALMVGLNKSAMLEAKGVKTAFATALFRDGNLSLARSARLAEMPLADFMSHLSRLGVPVIRLNAEETARDMDTLEEWLVAS